MNTDNVFPGVAIIGGGPAGLIAAEIISAAGQPVIVYDRMPSVARKFLMAGRGGLNLTHSDKPKPFLARYGASAAKLEPMLRAFSPKTLRVWADSLGQDTFVGTSGRVFPKCMKASPLLRAWLKLLAQQGVEFRLPREWLGWDGDGAVRFRNERGAIETITPRATLLALGGASWPRLGGDGSWAAILQQKNVALTPFRPVNVGVRAPWSAHFAQRFAGQPIKNAAFTCGGVKVRGEAMITKQGLEGGAIYALSRPIEAELEKHGHATIEIDMRPDHTYEQVFARLSRPRDGKSISTFLRQSLRLGPAAGNLLREHFGEGEHADPFSGPAATAVRVKNMPITVTGMMGLERAISTAGGISWASVDQNLMLNALPGVYAAGEMLDWDAPTGGYLLQACFSTGAWAAKAILAALPPAQFPPEA